MPGNARRFTATRRAIRFGAGEPSSARAGPRCWLRLLSVRRLLGRARNYDEKQPEVLHARKGRPTCRLPSGSAGCVGPRNPTVHPCCSVTAPSECQVATSNSAGLRAAIDNVAEGTTDRAGAVRPGTCPPRHPPQGQRQVLLGTLPGLRRPQSFWRRLQGPARIVELPHRPRPTSRRLRLSYRHRDAARRAKRCRPPPTSVPPPPAPANTNDNRNNVVITVPN